MPMSGQDIYQHAFAAAQRGRGFGHVEWAWGPCWERLSCHFPTPLSQGNLDARCLLGNHRQAKADSEIENPRQIGWGLILARDAARE